MKTTSFWILTIEIPMFQFLHERRRGLSLRSRLLAS